MKSLLCLIGLLALFSVPLQAGEDDKTAAIGISDSPSQYPPNDPLLKYKQQFYATVGSYWYPEINRVFATVPEGKVHIRFTIHADGSIHDVKVIDGEKFVQLAAISLDALRVPAPYKPFKPELIREVGDKYTDDFSFSIKGKTTGAPSPYSEL